MGGWGVLGELVGAGIPPPGIPPPPQWVLCVTKLSEEPWNEREGGGDVVLYPLHPHPVLPPPHPPPPVDPVL